MGFERALGPFAGPGQRPGRVRDSVPQSPTSQRTQCRCFRATNIGGNTRSAHPSWERTQCRSLAQPRPEEHHCAFSQPQQRAPIPGTHEVPFPRAAATGGAPLRLMTAAAARIHPGTHEVPFQAHRQPQAHKIPPQTKTAAALMSAADFSVTMLNILIIR